MAIYHLNARGCSPSTGAGAVRKAAYQSGQALVEERTGELCDYARKERVAAEGLALPAGAPAMGRGELWNAAERAWADAGGGRALVARRYEFALPRELDESGRLACVRDFCSLFPGRACDWAIHGDAAGSNPHAHVLVSALELGPDGFAPARRAAKGEKHYICRGPDGGTYDVRAAEWKAAKAEGYEKVYNFNDGRRRTMSEARAEGLGTADRKSKQPVSCHRDGGLPAFDLERAELMRIRAAWAGIANRHLAELAARTGSALAEIDHRSHAERGLDETPTVHEGGGNSAIHRANAVRNAEVRRENALIRELKRAVAEAERAVGELRRRVRERRRVRVDARVDRRKRARLDRRRRMAMATAAARKGAPACQAALEIDAAAGRVAEIDAELARLQGRAGGPSSVMSTARLRAQTRIVELMAERDRILGTDANEGRKKTVERPQGHRPTG